MGKVMNELKNILQQHRNGVKRARVAERGRTPELPTFSSIPDNFFDFILIEYRLTRADLSLLLYLYRRTYSEDNELKDFGIAPMLGLNALARHLALTKEELFRSLTLLEKLGLLSTVRSGQYFIRRFFTEEFDQLYGQTYGHLPDLPSS